MGDAWSVNQEKLLQRHHDRLQKSLESPSRTRTRASLASSLPPPTSSSIGGVGKTESTSSQLPPEPSKSQQSAPAPLAPAPKARATLIPAGPAGAAMRASHRAKRQILPPYRHSLVPEMLNDPRFPQPSLQIHPPVTGFEST